MSRNILILEDFKLVKNNLEVILKKHCKDRANVYTVESYDEAVHISLIYNFDIFLIDIELGKACETGIDFAKWLRSNKKYQRAIIIFETADSQNIHKYVNEFHCYGYLLKPYNPIELLIILNSLFEINLDSNNNLPNIDIDSKNFHLENSSYKIRISKNIFTMIKLSDIMFLEALQKKVIIHTIYEDIITRYLTLTQFMEQNSNKYFYRCKNCYIVNKHYCNYYDTKKKVIIISYNEKVHHIDVSRELHLEVKERFAIIE